MGKMAFNLDLGKQMGSQCFYKNGQEVPVEMKNNQPHGIILDWHKNGAMALKGEMKNGFLEVFV